MLPENLSVETVQFSEEFSVARLQEILAFFGDNPHLQAVVVVVGAGIIAKMADWFLTRGLVQVTRRTHAEVDDQIVAILHKPVFRTFLLMGVGVALRLDPPPEPLYFIILGIIKTAVILIWIFFGVRFTSILLPWMSDHPSRFQTIQPVTFPVFEITAKVVLFGAATYFLLLSWRVDPTAWLASAGIIGIAVGFAAKDTLANLFAGLSILADAPYKVGDFIVLDAQRGQITKIGLRSTRILTRDDIEITIPNSTVANSKIINESGGPSPKHRLRIPVGIAYRSDIDRLRKVLLEVADQNDHACHRPEPRVRFRAFGDSSLNFELLCWIENPGDRGLAQDSLNTAIYKALDQAGIEIPFPQRDVYIKQAPAQGASRVQQEEQ